MLGIIMKIHRRFRFGGWRRKLSCRTFRGEWELCLKRGRIIRMSSPSGWAHREVSEHILVISKVHSMEWRATKQ